MLKQRWRWRTAESLRKWKISLHNSSSLSTSWSWNPSAGDDSPCNWLGVRCSSDGGVVTEISLPEAGFNGTLAAFPFSSLPNLTALDLSYNHLYGPIPSNISHCPALLSLDLSDSYTLTGPIPEALAELANLEHLNLGGNAFTGPIPAFLARMSRLTDLRLDANNFTGQIPSSLGQLTNLERMDLSNNKLTGGLPTAFANLANMWTFEVRGNSLTRELSGDLFTSWPRLTYLSSALSSISLSLICLTISSLGACLPPW